jgi:hypothetical protein
MFDYLQAKQIKALTTTLAITRTIKNKTQDTDQQVLLALKTSVSTHYQPLLYSPYFIAYFFPKLCI